MVRLVRAGQYSNALSPISVKLSGRVMLLRLVQQLNAKLPIRVTLFWIVIISKFIWKKTVVFSKWLWSEIVRFQRGATWITLVLISALIGVVGAVLYFVIFIIMGNIEGMNIKIIIQEIAALLNL